MPDCAPSHPVLHCSGSRSSRPVPGMALPALKSPESEEGALWGLGHPSQGPDSVGVGGARVWGPGGQTLLLLLVLRTLTFTLLRKVSIS